jgi:hypothetical protein
MQWSWASKRAAIDYYQYWALGQAVSEGLVDNIYHASSRPYLARLFLQRAFAGRSDAHRSAAFFRKDDLQAVSTPLLYAFFSVQGSGNYDRDLAAYRGATLVATLMAVFLLCRLFGASALASLASVAVVAWVFPPLRYDLVDGNVNQIQFVLLVGFGGLLRVGSRRWEGQLAAGFLLGVAAFFKPNLAFVAFCLVLGWILTRRWQVLQNAFAGMVLGAVLSVAASSIFFGSVRCWGQWFEVLVQLDRVFDVAVHWGNFGGARLLREATGWDLSLALNVALLALTGWIVWRRRRSIGSGGDIDRAEALRLDLLLMGCGAPLPMLTMGLAWPHYLMLALPLALLLVFGAMREPAWRRPPAYGSLLFVGWLGITSALIFDGLQISGVYPRPVALALGTLVLYGLGLWEMSRDATPTTG